LRRSDLNLSPPDGLPKLRAGHHHARHRTCFFDDRCLCQLRGASREAPTSPFYHSGVLLPGMVALEGGEGNDAPRGRDPARSSVESWSTHPLAGELSELDHDLTDRNIVQNVESRVSSERKWRSGRGDFGAPGLTRANDRSRPATRAVTSSVRCPSGCPGRLRRLTRLVRGDDSTLPEALLDRESGAAPRNGRPSVR